jgi:hypothetical protein
MLQPNGIRFHCHDPLDRKTFGSHGMCLHLKNFFFDSLTLKPVRLLYVNLVGHFVAYLQPFNLVYR